MTCPPYDDLSAYADHMLKPRDQERFAAHLAGCPVCRRRLDKISALRQSLGALPSPALGLNLGARLEDRLRGRVGAKTPAAVLVELGARRLGGAGAPPASMVRVFDPVPPGGLCAAAELCRLSKGMQ